MDDDASSDIQKCLSDGPLDTDEGHVLNENSNGLSHLLTEGEFNSVDAVGVDESSASNPGFLNAVELSTSSVGDYLENNTGFNADSFDVGDNAVTFPSDSLNNVLSDGDSRLSDSGYKVFVSDTDGDVTENQPEKMDTIELSNGTSTEALADSEVNETLDDTNTSVPQDISMEAQELCPQEIGDSNIEEVKEVEVPVDTNERIVESVIENVDEIKSMETDDPDKTEIDEVKVIEIVEAQNEVVEKKAMESVKEVDVTKNEELNISSDKEKVGGAEETEVVSEDELPVVEKPSIKDAENVSDDELPEPKAAELPADTEVVSEDEFPASKKETKDSRKRKTDEDKADAPSDEESANKKQAVAKSGESKPIPSEKRSSTEEKPKKKALPELDKYWKVVKDDPTDFTGWTYLLQYVDQESEVEAAREAYDAFLSHYPYCYGYWRKYADYEKRKGSKKKCLEVLERGLKAIPLSVDLWIHYLNHIKATRTEDHLYIRSQFERAIEACGLEFRSDRLWEAYIKWEAENGSALHVTNIYDRLLATPTLGYTSHFDNFQEHVMSEPVSGVIPREEIIRLRAEVREGAGGAAPPPMDLPPGEDEPSDHVASDEEAQAIKERIIAARRKIHKATGEQVAARWTFEEGIKRPYFHVKPLERCQLKNWKSYLEWEKQHGSLKRALVLHERCLIACALYDQFWIRLIKFLEERSESDPSLIEKEREVLERACTIHHLDKPELHLYWAHFEEAQGNADKAIEILDKIEKTCPNVVQIQYRRINVERRRGDYDKCCQLFENYISSAKKAIASALSIKYARFLFHVKKDLATARKVLDDAIVKDPLNDRLHLQRLDLALLVPDTPYSELDELVQSYSKQENADVEVCAAFAWRRRELAEELGGAGEARAAHIAAKQLHKHLRKSKRAKHEHQPPPPAAAPPPSSTPSESTTKKKEAVSSASTNSGYYGGAQYDQQQYQYPPWGYPTQAPPPYPHHPPWPNYTNYY